MEIYWEDESPALRAVSGGLTHEEAEPFRRIDVMLPTDPEIGAVTTSAFRSYLSAMMEMTARYAQPLMLLAVAADESPALQFLGADGADLLARAIVRYLHQETRTHDVVGRSAEVDAHNMPTFLIACPLMTEDAAAQFAERIRTDMTAHASDPQRPWLTLSTGITGMALDVTGPDALIARAMAALDRARRQGGSRAWRHSDTLRLQAENDDRREED